MLLPISNALVWTGDDLTIELGIDGSVASPLPVPAVAMGTGGMVTGPANPSISGDVAAVLSVQAIALSGGSISGPGGGEAQQYVGGWWFSGPEVFALEILVLRELRRREQEPVI
jgi:hypothetical protein